MNKIKFGRVSPKVIMPSKRNGDGCYDVYAYFDEEYMVIQPHEVRLIPTGLCSTFSPEYRISVRERGSNTKSNLKVSAGQIDSSYTGYWFVALYNGNDVPVEITKCVDSVEKCEDFIRVPYSKAIAQFAVEYVPDVVIEETDAEYIQSLQTERGNGSLGSSNK